MTISGLLLKTERPEKNIPPQLTIVNSPPATAFVTPGMEWMSKNVIRLTENKTVITLRAFVRRNCDMRWRAYRTNGLPVNKLIATRC